ncbi:ATP-binding protein [Anaeromicropila herbilytica]|uniref:histidine kinase n=1 Tax=Anaeromicropila herbilytica TaxID=2785025 RepID=A0A7R7EMB0_9FIRM|nr:sensor histidine kinase [Anaeromicropila herbilytica]BCN31496.1 sensor histidine kinase [Anaeromicropila herbilytica]
MKKEHYIKELLTYKIKHPLSIMNKILITHISLIIFILLIVSTYMITNELQTLDHNIKDKILSLSNILSKDTRIVNALEENKDSKSLNKYLDELHSENIDIDLIVVVNKEEKRIYHPDKEKIGKEFSGNDDQKILAGSLPYVTDGKGSAHYQRRAFSSVRDKDGNVLGFVMVSAYLSTINNLHQHIILNCFILFIVSLLGGILFSYLVSQNIKNTLLGHEPDKFIKLYLQKEEVLESLEEGIIAIDQTGKCIFVNKPAKKMLVNHSYQEEEQIITNFINRHLLPVLSSKKAEYNLMLNMNDISIIMNKIPIIENNQLFGVVTLFRDKTEVTQLAEELTGVNHIMSALRANTHEHINKLHVILGLLQIGETKMAMDYISNESAKVEDGYYKIIQKIKNTTIAALILGKISRANELNIHMKIQKESFLDANTPYLSTNDLVTIIGNLIENAMDAVKDCEDVKEINLFLQSNEEGITIVVDDTGIGMSKEQIELIYTTNFTTKEKGHGIGLKLIKNIVERCDGIIEIESEPHIGTSFTIIFNRKPRTYMEEFQ